MGAEVSIVYKSLPHYRVAFFEGLRVWLAREGVTLRVLHGAPTGGDAAKDDQATIEWAEKVHSRRVRLMGREAIWQPVVAMVRSSDLVIVEQANKLLVNNLFMAWRRLGGPRLAFWGHGRNRNPATVSKASEFVKRRALHQCDWWFSYTNSTTDYLTGLGFPADRISTVNNAIDVLEYQRLAAGMSDERRTAVRASLELGEGPVAVFIGSLYESKRLDFLFQCADLLVQELDGFRLVIIGDGPQMGYVRSMASARPWVRVLGAKKGADLVETASLGDVMLMPGLVGLVILDSFALGLPLVSVDGDFHSPEIDYLRHGENGLLVHEGADPSEYAAAVMSLLRDRTLYDKLVEGCVSSAGRFSVDAMIDRFGTGVLECLGSHES